MDSRFLRKLYGFEPGPKTYKQEDSRLLIKLHTTSMNQSQSEQIEDEIAARKYGKIKTKEEKEKFLREKHPNFQRGRLR